MAAHLLGDDETRASEWNVFIQITLPSDTPGIETHPMARELEMAKAKPMYLSSTTPILSRYADGLR